MGGTQKAREKILRVLYASIERANRFLAEGRKRNFWREIEIQKALRRALIRTRNS